MNCSEKDGLRDGCEQFTHPCGICALRLWYERVRAPLREIFFRLNGLTSVVLVYHLEVIYATTLQAGGESCYRLNEDGRPAKFSFWKHSTAGQFHSQARERNHSLEKSIHRQDKRCFFSWGTAGAQIDSVEFVASHLLGGQTARRPPGDFRKKFAAGGACQLGFYCFISANLTSIHY